MDIQRRYRKAHGARFSSSGSLECWYVVTLSKDDISWITRCDKIRSVSGDPYMSRTNNRYIFTRVLCFRRGQTEAFSSIVRAHRERRKKNRLILIYPIDFDLFVAFLMDIRCKDTCAGTFVIKNVVYLTVWPVVWLRIRIGTFHPFRTRYILTVCTCVQRARFRFIW